MNFKSIISSQNEQIKHLAKLGQVKYRRESGLFLVENLAIIHDALAGGQDFEELFVTEDFVVKNPKMLEFFDTHSAVQEVYLINEKVNRSYSELSTPSGITALYRFPKRDLDSESVVYLDGVSDPGNLGTILRNALAFDFSNIILGFDCADLYNSKTISAAKDAIFKLNILEDRDGEWLEKNKLPLLATSSHKGTELRNFVVPKKFCLILGSESHGISDKLLKKADKKIMIPISEKIESLNVAAAAAILFYELSSKKTSKN